MVENAELRELYATLASVLDGYNKTHDTQVTYVDFCAAVPNMGHGYEGAVVCREYEHNLVDYHYRDLLKSDFDWYPENWTYDDQSRVIDGINNDRRRATQQCHRTGKSLQSLWWVKAKERQRNQDYCEGIPW